MFGTPRGRGALSGGSMPGFSQVTLLGHLTRDPELRYTPQGAAVCDLTVAIIGSAQEMVCPTRALGISP